MNNIIALSTGSYLLYELINPVNSCDLHFDTDVRLVTKYNELKNNTLGVNQENMERLLRNNSDLFVCFDRDIPVGMMWGHRGSCYIRGPGIPLLQDEETIYWFWVYTVPESRGKNVYKKLRDVFFCHYKSNNKFVALVDPGNKIMRKEMDKLGFVTNKQFYYIKINNVSFILEKCCKSQQIDFKVNFGNQNNYLII